MKAVENKSQNILRKEFMTFTKLKNLEMNDTDKFKAEDYVNDMSLRNARTFFRVRSHMIDVKMNQKSNKTYASELWKCDYCFSLDSQSHIMWCPAFSSLREGKNLHNDLDLVAYFQDVMKIRTSVSA